MVISLLSNLIRYYRINVKFYEPRKCSRKKMLDSINKYRKLNTVKSHTNPTTKTPIFVMVFQRFYDLVAENRGKYQS